MLPKKRIPTHPGEVLSEEFLKPLGMTQVALAAHVGVPVQRINELVRGKRGVTPETAWLLAGAFGTTPQFWLALQTNHDLAGARPTHPIRPVAKAG
jgi:addiction module HigA family antidote